MSLFTQRQNQELIELDFKTISQLILRRKQRAVDMNKDIYDARRLCPKYPVEAFEFVAAGLGFAVTQLKERRHLEAIELCENLKRFGETEFGELVNLVFREWGLLTSENVGEIVYALISCKVLSASEDDRPEDFLAGFSLLTEVKTRKIPAKLPRLD